MAVCCTSIFHIIRWLLNRSGMLKNIPDIPIIFQKSFKNSRCSMYTTILSGRPLAFYTAVYRGLSCNNWNPLFVVEIKHIDCKWPNACVQAALAFDMLSRRPRQNANSILQIRCWNYDGASIRTSRHGNWSEKINCNTSSSRASYCAHCQKIAKAASSYCKENSSTVESFILRTIFFILQKDYFSAPYKKMFVTLQTINSKACKRFLRNLRRKFFVMERKTLALQTFL